MSNLVKHAEREFAAKGWRNNDSEDPQNWICDNVIELLEVFSKQEHSGTSAPYLINIFKKLASYEPLGPITGEDHEWNEVGENMWQNNRCSHVFKDKDSAWDIDGKIFREPDGSCYTSFDSRVTVAFPYTPTREYVDVPESDGPD